MSSAEFLAELERAIEKLTALKAKAPAVGASQDHIGANHLMAVLTRISALKHWVECQPDPDVVEAVVVAEAPAPKGAKKK